MDPYITTPFKNRTSSKSVCSPPGGLAMPVGDFTSCHIDQTSNGSLLTNTKDKGNRRVAKCQW